MFLHRVPSAIQKLYPSLVWRKDTSTKTIYLTFDDGPIPDVTPWVLSELSKVQAKATFFCVGENVKKHPEIFRKVIEEGHSIGNHTYNHLNGWKTGNQVYLENIQWADEVINDLVKTDLFRPPYGRIKRAQIGGLTHKKIIMWDVLTGDFSQNLSPDTILEKSISATRNGSIVVFHDHSKAFKNLQATLPEYLQYFFERGYQFGVL